MKEGILVFYIIAVTHNADTQVFTSATVVTRR